MPRPLLIAIILIIVLTGGILFLIRSCMNSGFGGAPKGMKEQYASVPALYLEKDGKGVILTIMPHLKIHSYSRQGNMVRKSASTTYYLQTNDASTAAKLLEIKVKAQSDIKNHPVEVMGASSSRAWVFIGEPMAFDAMTLEKKADISILEQKNPALNGKFPAERRYYRFDPASTQLYFTALDGSKWKLNTQTLQATATDDDGTQNTFEKMLEEVEAAEKQYRADMDSLYEQKNRRPSNDYAARRISQAEYSRITKEYYADLEMLNQRRDSLHDRKNQLRDQERNGREIANDLESLMRGTPNYNELYVNQDTIAGQWFGLYSPSEFKKLSSSLQRNAENDETARRQLYISSLDEKRPGQLTLNKDAANSPSSQPGFLHGGFLLDKKTARPIRLPDNDFLVIYREQIGRDARIMLGRISITGKLSWTMNTGLKEWGDWFYNGRELLILGKDNEELSSGQINLLLRIAISDGRASRYDYYEDELRKE